jgi:hypothetical protein
MAGTSSPAAPMAAIRLAGFLVNAGPRDGS